MDACQQVGGFAANDVWSGSFMLQEKLLAVVSKRDHRCVLRVLSAAKRGDKLTAGKQKRA